MKSLLQITTPAPRADSVSGVSSDHSASQPTPRDVPSIHLALTNCVTYLINQRDVPTLPPHMSTPPDRLLDLKLFHHYVDMTRREQASTSSKMAKSVAEYPPICTKGTWTKWIVRLAVETPHLMDALLAFSAFHLRHVTNPDRSLTETAHRYMLRAIAEHSRQVSQGITSENAETVFATSTFIAFHVASEQLAPSGNDGKSLMHWFQPWDGIRSLLAVCWEHIKSPEIKSLIEYERTEEMLNQVEPEDSVKFNFLLDDLGNSNDPFLDEETRHAYCISVHYLNKISTEPLTRHILKFTGLVPKRFVELVLMKDPRAMAIIGYHLMLVKTHDQVWWLQGSAERDFETVLGHLPEAWLPKMEWAIQSFRDTPTLAKKTYYC
jgi:hypothetical protein